MKVTLRYILTVWVLVLAAATAFAQDDHSGHDHSGHDHSGHTHATTDQPVADNQSEHGPHGGHNEDCACMESHSQDFDPGALAFHHIADANAFHLFGDYYLPLPCILYAPEKGWSVFLSSKFRIGHHGDGEAAYDGYVIHGGEVMRVRDESFPMGLVEIGCYGHTAEEGRDQYYVEYQGECKPLDKKSSFDGGILGGGITSYYDFSITKNVFTMLLTLLLMFFLFRAVAKAYQTRDGQAPKGIQGLIEPIFLFIRDEVAIPFLGPKYERYLPFLMAIFFFILGLNLIGQLPIFPGSGNVTGNLAVTAILALFTFFVVNLSGNKDYWEHIFWMPGTPAWIKVILTPVELLGVFIKPLTLMLRLFANITAGHIVIIIFVSLIFIFGNAGESILGATIGGVMAVPLTLFMMAIELLVAFIQAFVFCILTASYIGAAVEEHHH